MKHVTNTVHWKVTPTTRDSATVKILSRLMFYVKLKIELIKLLIHSWLFVKYNTCANNFHTENKLNRLLARAGGFKKAKLFAIVRKITFSTITHVSSLLIFFLHVYFPLTNFPACYQFIQLKRHFRIFQQYVLHLQIP